MELNREAANNAQELALWIEKVQFLCDSMESTAQPFASGFPDGRLWTCNDAFCELTGYSRDDLPGCVTWSVDLTPPEWREHEASVLSELHRTGKPQKHEKEYIRKDGTIIPVELLVHQALDSNGNVLFYYSIVTNISDRKRNEKELRHSNDELDDMVKERTLELQKANDELKRQVDERKRTIEALRESEERYRAFFENSMDAVLITSPDGRIEAANPAACHMFGMTEDELIRGSRHAVVDTSDPRIERALEERKRTGRFRGELNLKRKDGTIFPVDESNAVFTDRNGKQKTAMIIRDITERKQTVEALSKTHALLDTLLAQAPIGFVYLDRDLRYVLINDRLAEINGIPAAAHIGKRLHDIVPSLVPTAQKVADRILATGLPVKDHEFSGETAQAPGVRRYWSESWYPVLDDSRTIAGFGAIVQEITERKRAEEALRESDKKFALALTNSRTVLFHQDLDLRYTWIYNPNPGFSGVDTLGKTDFDLLTVEDASRLTDIKRQVLETGVGKREEVRITIDGVPYFYDLTVELLLDEQGKATGIRGTSHDITEYKRAEHALDEAKKQAELYLDLMSHDINNMHQIAMGYLELAREMIPADVYQKELLEKPVEVLQRSAQLISNVRKMQKLLDGSLQYQVIDLRAVLSDVQREFGAVPRKPVTLNMNGSGPCHVRANELLRDVFSNLLTNAIKHTGDRADIVIALESVSENGGRYFRVSVTDNGPGITDDFKGIVFNRLLKGDSKAKGMGLGLYLVKSLVDSYGGRVRVEDRVKGDHTKGARFVVMLPAVEK